ncbi:hypothetical protein [Streptomyces sp. NRRL B-3229]|nr:hypothetical protein [Streptomyces sp. NRRL B-3229]
MLRQIQFATRRTNPRQLARRTLSGEAHPADGARIEVNGWTTATD